MVPVQASPLCFQSPLLFGELARGLGERGVIVFADVEHVIMKCDLALEMRDLGVVGIGPFWQSRSWRMTFLPALKHAKELGLPITLDCGEVRNQKEIQAMLEICPQRIGHACCLEEDEWRKLKLSKIPVEICLTFNVRTECVSSVDNHHFVYLYNSKHPLVLCTDDPGMFSTSLSNEHHLAASTFGLNKDEMFHLARNAIEFTFTDDEVKKALTEIFDAIEKRIVS